MPLSVPGGPLRESSLASQTVRIGSIEAARFKDVLKCGQEPLPTTPTNKLFEGSSVRP